MAVPLVPTQATAAGKSPTAVSFALVICESNSSRLIQLLPVHIAAPMRSTPSPRPQTTRAILSLPGSAARSTKWGTLDSACDTWLDAAQVDEPDALVE